jgi:hypothetical protein
MKPGHDQNQHDDLPCLDDVVIGFVAMVLIAGALGAIVGVWMFG